MQVHSAHRVTCPASRPTRPLVRLGDGPPLAASGARRVELPDAGHIFAGEEVAVWAGHVARFLDQHGR